MAYTDRITGYGKVSPKELQANPANWRTHPKYQQSVMDSMLKEIGWVQNVIVNKTTGLMIDGHLRVELALKNKEESVPVTYVSLDEHEEALVLASLDPIGALAGQNNEALARVLSEVATGEAPLQELLGNLSKSLGMFEPESESPGRLDEAKDKSVECPECGAHFEP